MKPFKVRMDMLEQTREAVNEEQQHYFQKLIDRVGPVNMQVSEKNLRTLEQRLTLNMEKGRVLFEPMERAKNLTIVEDAQFTSKVRDAEREQETLKQKLKSIDFELTSLQKQRIENPFSAYSQPSLKVYVDEDEMRRQRQAAEFVRRVNQKETEERDKFNKKMREEQQVEKIKEKELEDHEKDEKVRRQKEKHEKIRKHIAQLKTKHESRLQEMMQMEEKYFKELDAKLNKLKDKRQHLKGTKVGKSVMITGVKKMKLKDGRLLDRTMTKSETRASPEPTAKKSIKPGTSTSAVKGQAIKTDDQITKNIEIEKPLYRRLQDKYREKLKKELTAMKEEKRKLMDHRGNYSNIDFLNHLAAYKKKKQELKEKYERKRIEKLKKLGLIEGKSKNPNVSFDSKLWLFNEPEPLQQNTKHEELKQKRLKVLSYAENVKENNQVNVDGEKRLRILIARDKLINPEKYVRTQKARESLPLTKEEIYQMDKELYEREFIKPDPEEHRRLQVKTGNANLEDLPKLIEKARELRRKELEESKKTKKKLDPNFRISSVKSADALTRSQALPKLYFEEVKKRYKLEEKAADLDNWQKIVDEREHPKLPRIKSEYGSVKHKKAKENDEEPNHEALTRFQREQMLKQRRRQEHKRRMQEVNEKLRQELKPKEPSDAEKIKDVSQHLDIKAQRMEQIVQAKWKTKPLLALQEEDQVNNIYIDSIKAKLKILELGTQTSKTPQPPKKA